MTLFINNLGSKYNLHINQLSQIKQPSFRGVNEYNAVSDTFVKTSELSPYLSTAVINQMIMMNPKIAKILRDNGIKLEININELQTLADGHLKCTKNIASGIIDNLSPEIRSGIDRKAVLEAAVFHDFGKVLIPQKVLNKKTSLNEKEKGIMELHSELGYELLKNQNISPHALELVKYHHQTPDNKGYPQNNSGFEYGIESEIIAISDKYSALREKRSYKQALTRDEALEIIKRDGCSREVFDALVKYTAQVV